MSKKFLTSPDFGLNKGVNCADPTAAQDVATKNYVDTNSIGGTPFDRQNVTSVSTFSTTSATYVDIASMTLTTKNVGGSALYNVLFSCAYDTNAGNPDVSFRIVVDGTPIAASETTIRGGNRAAATVTAAQSALTSGKIVKIQAMTTASTLNVYNRSLIIDGIRSTLITP